MSNDPTASKTQNHTKKIIDFIIQIKSDIIYGIYEIIIVIVLLFLIILLVQLYKKRGLSLKFINKLKECSTNERLRLLRARMFRLQNSKPNHYQLYRYTFWGIEYFNFPGTEQDITEYNSHLEDHIIFKIKKHHNVDFLNYTSTNSTINCLARQAKRFGYNDITMKIFEEEQEKWKKDPTGMSLNLEGRSGSFYSKGKHTINIIGDGRNGKTFDFSGW